MAYSRPLHFRFKKGQHGLITSTATSMNKYHYIFTSLRRSGRRLFLLGPAQRSKILPSTSSWTMSWLLAGGLLLGACQNSPEKGKESQQKIERDTVTEQQTHRNTGSSAVPEGVPVRGKLDSLNRLVDKDSTNLEALVARARYHMRRNQSRKAQFDLYRAKRLDSTNAELLLALGQLRMNGNRSRAARNLWKRCINRHPENVPCRIKLAKLYHAVGLYDKALPVLNEALELDRYAAEAYFYKGLVVRDKTKDTTRAMPYFQRATELKDYYPEALDALGVLLTGRNDSLAPYYFQRILDREPKRADIFYKLGVHYMNTDQPNKAIEAYTKATEINPKDADSFYNMGFMFVQMKDYASARDYFAKGIRAQPKSYKSYYGRAYAYEMLGDVINAKEDYQKVLELLPQHKPAQKGLRRVTK